MAFNDAWGSDRCDFDDIPVFDDAGMLVVEGRTGEVYVFRTSVASTLLLINIGKCVTSAAIKFRWTMGCTGRSGRSVRFPAFARPSCVIRYAVLLTVTMCSDST